MALSWADHRRMEDSQPGMVKLPDGSLIMTGQKPVHAKPGMLAGLRDYFAAKLRPRPAQEQPYWIPQPAPVAPVVAPAPAQPASPAPGGALPNYNEWSAIEDEVAKEQRIKDAMGALPQNVMSNRFLIEGKF